MVDLRSLREDPQTFRQALRRRGRDPSLVDQALELDRSWREALQEVERLRAQQNRASEEVARLAPEARGQKIAEVRELAARLRELEPEVRRRREELERVLLLFPNTPHPTVPDGVGEQDNVVVRTWGTPPRFDFEPKDHVELGLRLGILDFERAAKVSGSRFYYLLGKGALLEMALVRYALDRLLAHGFVPVIPPVLVRPEIITGAWGGATFDPQQTYRVAEDDLALIGTSEQSLAGFYRDEVLDAQRLPVRFAGISWCFRREAGAHGRETRGLYRVHQFDKVEMFSFAHPERSWEEHEFLVSVEEEILQGLGIPYRVVLLCAGDLGTASAKTYDLEAWMPGRGAYGEVTSCSNTTDFQARRLNVRFRERGRTEFVHTLNGTALATSRVLIALLENYQQPDGSVRIPEALVPYTGFDRVEPAA
ncbi:MAG: serine--tRNA ligase [Armatimonadota bacterium]|nr:serine--tRNA ligase [Armatimonadota bacterium]MDR5675611.1 serine--tRNA ligase [Armatimonadota bacterium]MDR5689129.1 serine--tRNA ligase [Armatimonadota bacterium]MDR7386045.1 serine--tRNA ligase [Armatimonadota bacterium]MDR7389331.1 serine--tRNA ligase [Armatimonadota bacterium]